MLRLKKPWYCIAPTVFFCGISVAQNPKQPASTTSPNGAACQESRAPQPASSVKNPQQPQAAVGGTQPASVAKTPQSTETPQAAPPPEIPASLQDSESDSDSSDSLAAAAAQAKAQKGHAKMIVDDENIGAGIGPLPRLKANQAENGEEVIAAIKEYKAKHTPEETEQVVRRWYEEYDEELKAAIDDNLDIQGTRAANLRNGYDICQNPQQYRDYEDYRRCQQRWWDENRGARHDQIEIAQNNQWIVRLQHSMMNIRNQLFMMGLSYDWFKVRTTNGVDRF